MDLLKLNVAPLAVFQMLKSMCAGQRLAGEPQDPAAVSLPTSSVPETRGQIWARCSLPLRLRGWVAGEGSGQRQAQRRLGPEWPGPTVGLLPGPAGTIQGPPSWFPVPSFIFVATLESAHVRVQIRWMQNGCPGCPKQARPHLGFCLPPWGEELPFRKDRNKVVLVPVLMVCTASRKVLREWARVRLSCPLFACTLSGPRCCSGT